MANAPQKREQLAQIGRDGSGAGRYPLRDGDIAQKRKRGEQRALSLYPG